MPPCLSPSSQCASISSSSPRNGKRWSLLKDNYVNTIITCKFRLEHFCYMYCDDEKRKRIRGFAPVANSIVLCEEVVGQSWMRGCSSENIHWKWPGMRASPRPPLATRHWISLLAPRIESHPNILYSTRALLSYYKFVTIVLLEPVCSVSVGKKSKKG